MSYYHHLIKSAVVPAYGALTTAWITATSETDTTIISALNTLETDLTTYGLTAKIKALYPMVGGTAAKHKFNFMDARDLDAAYRLTFNGGWVHSANGALGNGINTYANTYFNNLNNFTDFTKAGLGIYSRTNETGVFVEGNSSEGGASTTSNFSLYPKHPTVARAFETQGATYGSVPNSLGLSVGSIVNSSSKSIYKNGVKIATDTTVLTLTASNKNVFFGALNIGTGAYNSNKQYAMCLITEGMNDTNQTNLYTSVQAFQTTLSRQV